MRAKIQGGEEEKRYRLYKFEATSAHEKCQKVVAPSTYHLSGSGTESKPGIVFDSVHV